MQVTYVNGDIYENFDGMQITLFDKKWRVKCITNRYATNEVGSLYCTFKELGIYITIVEIDNKIIAKVHSLYVLNREFCNFKKNPLAYVRSDIVQILKNHKIYFESRRNLNIQLVDCYYNSDLQKTLNDEVQNNSDIQELIMKLSGKKFRKILGLFFMQSCQEALIKKVKTKI